MIIFASHIEQQRELSAQLASWRESQPLLNQFFSGYIVKYALTPDIGFKGVEMYAVCPMGIFDDIVSARIANRKLHSSFGYCIYPVEDKITKRVNLMHGLLKGEKPGYKIVGNVIYSFDVI